MNQKADLQFAETLRKKIKSLNSNKQCIYPGCKQNAIRSHIIPESVLALLANAEGKILTWEYTDEEVFVYTIRKQEWKYIYRQPKMVHIGKDVTYPIFCGKHDNDVFKALEKPGYSFEPQQVALLAYRALCYKTWNPNLEKKLEFELSNEDPATAIQLERISSLKPMLAARQQFENMLETNDYRQIRWVKRIFRINSCLACADANVSFDSREDVINIANGKTVIVPEDVVTFTFYPDENLKASICVITWFKDNARGERFIESLQLNNPSEIVVRNNIINNVLRMSLVYTSLAWWDSLLPEEQHAISRLQMSKISSLSDL